MWVRRHQWLITYSSSLFLFLKLTRENFFMSRWSVILPLTWISSAFWVPLVFAGGHVIGVRERHWLHTDVGITNIHNHG